MDEKISLNGVWQWSAADSDAVHPGIVPGSVLSDMLALNLCEDPTGAGMNTRSSSYSTRTTPTGAASV